MKTQQRGAKKGVSGRGWPVTGLRGLLFLAAGILALSAAPPVPREPTLIVNPDSPVTSLTAAQVRNLYTGKLSELDGQKMVPINQNLESDLAVRFLKKFISMTPAEYKEFWVNQQLRSGGVPPMVQKTSVNVRLMVSQLPGGIGYVWPEEVDETVRAVPVSP